MTARFLQIHTLHSHPAALLNRDDVGMAKRLPFGGATRTRVSSQCLKRHWRMAEDGNALGSITLGEGTVPMSIRSRQTFDKEVLRPLIAEGVERDRATAATSEVLQRVLPQGKKKAASKSKDGSAVEPKIETEQVTVIGRPEINYLRDLARQIAGAEGEPAAAAKELLDQKEMRANLKAMIAGAGLDAAMFGRMTTGDVLSRCDAAIHVAHAFTVHEGNFEADYFSAVDDLLDASAGETGSGHINSTELTSGLFYGYVVVDIPLLVSNIQACDRKDWEDADRTLASESIRRLLHLIATVSPGAKLGSTAPYSYAELMLAELGDAQPRTLANAFFKPVSQTSGGTLEAANEALARELTRLDAYYPTKIERCLATKAPAASLSEIAKKSTSLPELANWAASAVRG